jgi:hypothetical protein
MPMPSRRRRRAEVRVSTSLLIIGLCIFAVPRGWSAGHFAIVHSILARNESDNGAVIPWIGSPGITAAAMSASLTQMTDAADLDGGERRADDLVALLSVRPLSSRNWLSLAEIRLITARPKEEVRTALKMSWVTGPNEGVLMWQRGVFGLFVWDFLSSEERQQTITQIARAMSGMPIGDDELVSAQKALSQESLQTRAEIANRMRAEAEAEAARLGL